MKRKDLMKALASVTLCVTGALCVCACGGKKQSAEEVLAEASVEQAPVRDVVYTKAVRQEVPQIETFTGTVEGYATNNISPKASVRIEKIFVEVGNHVRAGQKLAQMDVSGLTQAKLKMENDKIEFERTKQLYEVGGISKSEYDTKKKDYEVSLSEYENSAINTYLVSPINGVVTARNYDAGDMYASADGAVFTVEQIRPVKIKVNVSEVLYPYIKKDTPIDITLDVYGDEIFKGKVHIVYPSLDASTRTFPVEVTIDNANERVRPGMFARVAFKYATANNVVVPDVAVVKQTGSGDHYVYTVDENNKVVFKKVKLGRVIGTNYEIKSGVEEGDKVIIQGLNVVTNGAQVNAKEGEPAPFTPDNLLN